MAAVSDNARWQGHGNSKAKLVRNPSAKTGMRPLALWANPDRARGSPLLAMAPMAWPNNAALAGAYIIHTDGSNRMLQLPRASE